VDEVTGEPLYRDRVCGIGIGVSMVAMIRVSSETNRRDGWPRPAASQLRGGGAGAGGLAAVPAGEYGAAIKLSSVVSDLHGVTGRDHHEEAHRWPGGPARRRHHLAAVTRCGCPDAARREAEARTAMHHACLRLTARYNQPDGTSFA
jgi:hypothetical protein